MSSNNFVALKLLIVIQVVHTSSKCDTEYTITEAKSFAGLFGEVFCFFCFVLR